MILRVANFSKVVFWTKHYPGIVHKFWPHVAKCMTSNIRYVVVSYLGIEHVLDENIVLEVEGGRVVAAIVNNLQQKIIIMII